MLPAEVLEERQLLSTITVNSTGDADGADGSDTLSLRQAIEISNGTLAISSLSTTQAALVSGALSMPNTIDFDIPGTGPFTIAPTSVLPNVTNPMIIDGYSQPGAQPNTNGPQQADNAVIPIVLSVANEPPHFSALDITAGGSTVQGLATSQIILQTSGGDTLQGDFLDNASIFNGTNTIGGTTPATRNVISGVSTGALEIDGSSNLVEGNFIGTDATGTVALSKGNGVLISGNSNTIGGTTAAAGNVISGNAGIGVDVGVGFDISGSTMFSSSDNLVEGNLIGTDLTGTKAVPNNVGISISSDSNTIGGTAAGAGNLISGNLADGVDIESFITEFLLLISLNNQIEGNLIGTDSTGTMALPNAKNGIDIAGGMDSTIGGTAPGTANIIAFNGGAGVGIESEDGNSSNTISGNSIYANDGPGIDLGDDGVTPNNPAGSPNGPNLLQPYPVLTSATPTSTGTTISATLGAAPSTSYTIEFFSNPAADPSGFGQGKTYLGSTVATTDANGHASFGFTLATSLDGQFLSATATDPSGNTSEFAKDIIVSSTSPTTTTTTTLAGPSSPSAFGQPATFTATVTEASGVEPTGYVIFAEAGVVLATVPLDASGQATLVTTQLTPGVHVIAAAYLGDLTHSASLSNYVAADIQSPSTSTTLIGPSGSLVLGQPATFAAVVTSIGAGVATGQVDFLEDGVVIGSAPLNPSGVTVFITRSLPPGPHEITAAYVGDPTLAVNLSNAIAVGVFAPLAFGGPGVTSVVEALPDLLTIDFNRGLFPGPAEDESNYTIVGPGNRAIAVKSAVYDPKTATVTLTTLQELNPNQSYELTINGQTGDRVVDVFGIPLNGQKDGKPGHNFAGKIKKAPVVKAKHPSGPKAKVKVARV